ncbi:MULTISPECIES: hypothetical protein [unclassified Variovorax]|uniref:hypothetical protein n=1 Tax=unclassified Variovorax TaxID=663243 RepID=UPI001E488FBF|nr:MULTISPECIES: hypothetical protein [unclassified Variovorax]
MQVQFQAHCEQQHRHPYLRQKVDLVVRGHESQASRAHCDAHDDVGNQYRLAQPHEEGAGQRAGQQQKGELGEGCVHMGGAGWLASVMRVPGD